MGDLFIDANGTRMESLAVAHFNSETEELEVSVKKAKKSLLFDSFLF